MNILAYFLAIPVFIASELLALLALMPLAISTGGVIYRRNGLAETIYHFLTSIFVGVVGSLGVSVMCWGLGVTPAFFMYLIPILLQGSNDFQRIALAEAGTSRVAQWSVRDGVEYNPKREGKIEFSKTMGHLLGAIMVPFFIDTTIL